MMMKGNPAITCPTPHGEHEVEGEARKRNQSVLQPLEAEADAGAHYVQPGDVMQVEAVLAKKGGAFAVRPGLRTRFFAERRPW